MTRYFFNIRSHDGLLEDPEGEELSSFVLAQEAAHQSVIELVIDALRSGQRFSGKSLEITTRAGGIENTILFDDVARGV